MCNQSIQLEIMAEGGGFDIDQEHTDNDYDGVDYLTPETLVITKAQAEEILSNPCLDCIHENTVDPYLLDYCHYECKDSAIVIMSEVV